MLCTWQPSLASEPFAFLKWGQLQQWLQTGNCLPGYTEADVQLTLGR
ncbi:MAG: hypothetical protein HY690_19355 [Chloroflexi bacterium]|nr:hypothetical protein [Chloroflexota bacterium]